MRREINLVGKANTHGTVLRVTRCSRLHQCSVQEAPLVAAESLTGKFIRWCVIQLFSGRFLDVVIEILVFLAVLDCPRVVRVQNIEEGLLVGPALRTWVAKKDLLEVEV